MLISVDQINFVVAVRFVKDQQGGVPQRSSGFSVHWPALLTGWRGL